MTTTQKQSRKTLDNCSVTLDNDGSVSYYKGEKEMGIFEEQTMTEEQARDLHFEVEEELPQGFRTGKGGPCQSKDGSWSFGIFCEEPYECLCSIQNRQQWEVLKKFAYLLNEKEMLDIQEHVKTEVLNDMSHFDDGEGHQVIIAVDGSHHDPYEFVG